MSGFDEILLLMRKQNKRNIIKVNFKALRNV